MLLLVAQLGANVVLLVDQGCSVMAVVCGWMGCVLVRFEMSDLPILLFGCRFVADEFSGDCGCIGAEDCVVISAV